MGGGVFCIFDTPSFPSSLNRSEQEKFFKQSQFHFTSLSNEDTLKNVWENKSLHYVDDFKAKEDLLEAISAPDSYEDVTGIIKFKDHNSNTVNTKNGIRVTTNQPNNPKRTIFLVGLCTTFGVGSDDTHTIASYLQRKLNANLPKEGFIVYNYGYFMGGLEEGRDKLIKILKSLPAKENDIILFNYRTPIYKIPYCDMHLNSKRPHNYGDIFLDSGHYTANGNRMMADGIYDFLKGYDFFKDTKMNFINFEPLSSVNNAKNNENPQLTKYKNELKTFFKEKISPKIGSIVMNANPFTYGHRYLIETALKHCDYLIIFVVEEDKSEIPFNDRFSLVKENVKDLPNVFARPSGEFIISSKTFSEYFRKESIQEQKIDTTLDVTLFAKEIAPCLNISVRFAGKEPTDKITEQYNRDMAQILPQYDIEFVEIERKQTNSGEVISASTVRKLAKEKKFDKLKTLAPPATIEYLRKKYE